MKLGALLTWIYGLALKLLLRPVEFVVARDCPDNWEWKEREVWTLGASLCLQSMDTVTDKATQLA